MNTRGIFSTSSLRIALALTVLFMLPSASANAQKRAEDEPVFREYRGVQIGMTAEEARKKLGSPKDKGDEQDFYIFNDNETAQVMYDKTHKVSALSVDFAAGAAGVPTAKTVMGADIDAKPDGSVYKMIRYSKAGFWVCYSRTAGDAPMTSITIQKID